MLPSLLKINSQTYFQKYLSYLDSCYNNRDMSINKNQSNLENALYAENISISHRLVSRKSNEKDLSCIQEHQNYNQNILTYTFTIFSAVTVQSIITQHTYVTTSTREFLVLNNNHVDC